MKRVIRAVIAMGASAMGSVASAQDERALTDPYRVAIEVSKAVDAADSKLSVFRPGVREDGSWGLALISGISSERDGTILHQAYLGELGRYFYPASTVKLYAALAAYETVNELALVHPDANISETTPLRIYPMGDEGFPRDFDPTHTKTQGRGIGPGPLTPAREAHKIFVVSDNPAFNTLYDFVGQDDLNRRIRQWGAHATQIVHRLAIALTADENRRAPRVDLGFGPGAPQIGERTATMPHAIQPQTEGFLLGRGFLQSGTLVEEPFDFSDKNFTTLLDLQLVLARLVRPDISHFECCPTIRDDGMFASMKTGPLPGRPIDLTDAQRVQLIASATMYPRESVSPRYDPAEYPDDHAKFLLPGLLRVRPLEEWRIVNKIGLAYGFVTENAYVEHRPTGHAVFVAAVIHRNPNGIYNDNQYDYETTLAEMATLGEVVGRALVGD
tara:strand:- start:15825 stop:17153 length:1329 start_codon:yes stop_codon:yes gene_type:complete